MTRSSMMLGAIAIVYALCGTTSAQTTVQTQPPTVASLLDEAKAAAAQQRFDDAKRLLQQALGLIEAQQAAQAAAATTDKPRVIKAGQDGVLEPRPVGGKAKPVYPRAAIDQRVQGIVIVQVIVGTDGHVRDASATRGPELLQQAALDAVRQWTYVPTRLNGEPIEVTFTVNVIFQLGGAR